MATKKSAARKGSSKKGGVDLDDLITIREAAGLRGVSVSALGDLVRRGRLQSWDKFGRKLVSRREVEAFQDARGWPKGRSRKGGQ